MSIRNEFIDKTIDILEENEISVTDFSGLYSLDIELNLDMDITKRGQIWIEGKKGSDKGQIVTRTHTETVGINDIEKNIKELTKRGIKLLNIDKGFKMKIETRPIYPDINEPIDTEILYSSTLYMIKKEDNPKDAYKDLKRLLTLPKKKLVEILKNVEF